MSFLQVTKDEIVLEFNQPEQINKKQDSLLEMRFYVPNTEPDEDDEEENPKRSAEVMFLRIILLLLNTLQERFPRPVATFLGMHSAPFLQQRWPTCENSAILESVISHFPFITRPSAQQILIQIKL
jgi:hypothetical protein